MKIDLTVLPFIYWSNKTKIDYLQRRIIVYSILYYQYDKSIISDKDYDYLTKQYLELVENTSIEEFKKTQYYYCFRDYDGSTGFDLFDLLSESDRDYLLKITEHIIKVGGKLK